MPRAWSFTVACNTSRISPARKTIPCHRKALPPNEQDRFTRGGEEAKQFVVMRQIRHRAQSGSFCLLSQRGALGVQPRHVINY